MVGARKNNTFYFSYTSSTFPLLLLSLSVCSFLTAKSAKEGSNHVLSRHTWAFPRVVLLCRVIFLSLWPRITTSQFPQFRNLSPLFTWITWCLPVLRLCEVLKPLSPERDGQWSSKLSKRILVFLCLWERQTTRAWFSSDEPCNAAALIMNEDGPLLHAPRGLPWLL